MNAQKTKWLIIFCDWLMAVASWMLFFYYRKTYIEEVPFELSNRFYQGVIIIPLFWLMLHYLLGTYHDVRRLYLTRIINLTGQAVFIGAIVIFFTVLLDDEIQVYSAFYNLIFALTLIHFTSFIIPRLIITYFIVNKVHRRVWGAKTLLIGGSQKAVDIYTEIESLPKGIGNSFVGFVNINGIDTNLDKDLPHLGHADNLEDIISRYGIEEVIIALDSSEHEKLKQLTARAQAQQVRIKLIPDMFDLLSGSVKMNNIFGALLIEVEHKLMPFWQFAVKRLIDIVVSLFALIILIPVYLFLAILVKKSSKGPVFFKQERVGKNGRTFFIIKFRTMYIDAEKLGPQLSSANDPRITGPGRIMRKMRLDELPQFWNVLVGEMSLVGPRPERQFFIDQIAKKEPQFLQLTMIKPGITSWGQVKFGYAENIGEMIQRMKYDLLYIKNMSLALDFKILLHTILIVLKGSGK